MRIINDKIIDSVVLALSILLSACSGGGGNDTSTSITTGPQMGGSIQGIPLNLAPTVSTLAGAVPGADGTGAAARFGNPDQIVSDGINLYVADSNNNKIRKIVIATGVVTTLAGTGVAGAADGAGAGATFNYPAGITTDGTNLYVTDQWNNKIRKIVIATGEVSSLTGVANTATNPLPPSATDGAGTAATFKNPAGITTDGTNLYVADAGNNKIRKVVIATGVVSSLTGVPNVAIITGGAVDGAGTTATFDSPHGITTDGSNLYVADLANHKIRKIVIATGEVSSFTGVANTAGAPGVADGAAAVATFGAPEGIATDGVNLYVTDVWNSKIRKIVIATGEVSSFTGVNNTASALGSADGAGSLATFNWPSGITIGGNRLYVSEVLNNTIRSVALADAAVSTLAGNVFGTDGVGAAASFSQPSSITTDGSNLYVADSSDHKIRKIAIATGVVSTLAGTGVQGAADGAGSVATFNWPSSITTDGVNLYVAEYGNNKIRKIVIATGMVSSLTGVANTPGTPGATDGAGATAKFYSPLGITTDGRNLYVADTFNNKIRKVVIATGAVSSLTGVANTAGVQGATDGPHSAATFIGPQGITTDGSFLYVADRYNNKIRKIEIATGVVSSLTGVTNSAGAAGAADGAGVAATFNGPVGITADGRNLYVADVANHKIRKIVISTGEVSSLTGVADSVGSIGADDGAGSVATFAQPAGITTDGSSVYVTDNNNTIRKIQ